MNLCIGNSAELSGGGIAQGEFGLGGREAVVESGLRVIVADDHPLFSEAIAEQIENSLSGAKCECVETFGSVLARLEAGDVDMLVLDWDMPGMEGLPSIRVLRERYPSVPMVILSGFISSIGIEEILSFGVQGLVPKSMSGKAITSAISVVLNGGTYMPAQAAMASPAAHSKPNGSTRPVSGLTAREVEVLHCLAEGLTNKEIARRLGLQEVTVKMHTSRLFAKLGVRNRVQAVSLALSDGLLESH
ncbi:MAG: DNA-binding response regulator [Parvibaculum sp.]|nr:DNA-binding response regulator [Parvibaculum sp.]